MNPYNKDAICVKCGSDDIHSHYRRDREWCYCECAANTKEHICRCCRNCNYRWPEAILDIESRDITVEGGLRIPRMLPNGFKIDELDLLVRTRNALSEEHIKCIGDLRNKKIKDLLKIMNFGKRSLQDLKDALSRYDKPAQEFPVKDKDEE